MGPVTYKTELPPTTKRLQNVFHVSKVKQYLRPENEKITLSVVIDAEGNIEHEVKKILDKRKSRRKF